MPRWYWRQGNQANSQDDRDTGRQTNKHSDRQADCEAYRSSEVQRSNHSRQPARFRLQGVSLCSAPSNNTTSSLYFPVWGFSISWGVLLYVTILCAGRLLQSSGLVAFSVVYICICWTNGKKKKLVNAEISEQHVSHTSTRSVTLVQSEYCIAACAHVSN